VFTRGKGAEVGGSPWHVIVVELKDDATALGLALDGALDGAPDRFLSDSDIELESGYQHLTIRLRKDDEAMKKIEDESGWGTWDLMDGED